MKIAIGTYLFLMTFISISFAQPCMSNGLTIMNSNDIETFLSQNGSCSELKGDLVIGPKITNLDGLENIKIVGGYLSVSNCDSLIDASGLQNLTYVGSWVRIQHNPNLSDLDWLQNLTHVKGEFFYTSDNPKIKKLNFSKLDSIEGIFQIYEMDSIKNLNGLEQLQYIGSDFRLFKNPQLVSMKGLSGLQNIKGDISIYENNALTSIADMNMDLKIDSYVSIYDNSNLSTCNANAICEKLDIEPNLVLFKNNKTGCSENIEVEASCTTHTLEPDPFSFKIYPNPAYDFLYIENYKNACIYNEMGEFMSLNIESNIVNISSLSAGTYVLKCGLQIFKFIKI